MGANPRDALARACALVGGAGRLALATGYRLEAVQRALARGRIPPLMAAEIERATGGAVAQAAFAGGGREVRGGRRDRARAGWR